MDPFIGEIRIFGGNFAPRGWAFCDGQLLPINNYVVLFSVLGTTYGGDGRTTFALPDLRGRVPSHAGRGPGLSDRRLGGVFGQETVTLTEAQLPPHTHTALASSAPATDTSPRDGVIADSGEAAYSAAQLEGQMDPASVSAVGGSQAHTNVQPCLVVRYIIALEGLYPSRS